MSIGWVIITKIAFIYVTTITRLTTIAFMQVVSIFLQYKYQILLTKVDYTVFNITSLYLTGS